MPMGFTLVDAAKDWILDNIEDITKRDQNGKDPEVKMDEVMTVYTIKILVDLDLNTWQNDWFIPMVLSID